MSAVDVMAVLDREISTSEALESSDALHAHKLPTLREARAAVAELVAAAARLALAAERRDYSIGDPIALLANKAELAAAAKAMRETLTLTTPIGDRT